MRADTGSTMRREIAPHPPRTLRPLTGMRIAVCGKGGAGKSAAVALIAKAFARRGYRTDCLDADASNPGGLTRLLFGLRTPRPLIDFFGGRARVECPVDDPSPLTRPGDDVPITHKHLTLTEIPPEYYLRDERLLLFQVGKLRRAYEGCEGPMSKIARDFTVEGDRLTVIDLEAGLEHFGRGAERNADVVLVIVDPTFESFVIAAKASRMCKEMGIGRFWAVLNKVESDETEEVMREAMNRRGVRILGSVRFDARLIAEELRGVPIAEHSTARDLDRLVLALESKEAVAHVQ